MENWSFAEAMAPAERAAAASVELARVDVPYFVMCKWTTSSACPRALRWARCPSSSPTLGRAPEFALWCKQARVRDATHEGRAKLRFVRAVPSTNSQPNACVHARSWIKCESVGLEKRERGAKSKNTVSVSKEVVQYSVLRRTVATPRSTQRNAHTHRHTDAHGHARQCTRLQFG